MLSNCKNAMDNSPIIAAIKDMAGLEKCLTCDSQVIFILFGDICNIADIVDKVKAAGKTAMVHIDLRDCCRFHPQIHPRRRNYHHKTSSYQTSQGIRAFHDSAILRH